MYVYCERSLFLIQFVYHDRHYYYCYYVVLPIHYLSAVRYAWAPAPTASFYICSSFICRCHRIAYFIKCMATCACMRRIAISKCMRCMCQRGRMCHSIVDVKFEFIHFSFCNQCHTACRGFVSIVFGDNLFFSFHTNASFMCGKWEEATKNT